MTITINGLAFDHAAYDRDGDVLYLSKQQPAAASDAALTPEGHGVRYDADGAVIGLTFINARWLLDRDRHLVITLPRTTRIEAAALAAVMA